MRSPSGSLYLRSAEVVLCQTVTPVVTNSIYTGYHYTPPKRFGEVFRSVSRVSVATAPHLGPTLATVRLGTRSPINLGKERGGRDAIDQLAGPKNKPIRHGAQQPKADGRP